jgi:hypothetical protein
MVSFFFNLKKNKKINLIYLNNKSKLINNNNINKKIIDSKNKEICTTQHDREIENSLKLTNHDVYLHNVYGLGDSVFNMILFNLIKEYIIDNNIQIYYFTKKEYIFQLNQFNDSNNVKIFSVDKKPEKSIELWINNNYFNYSHIDYCYCNKKSNKRSDYNKYYLNFFNIVLRKLKFNTSISSILYSDNDLLTRIDTIPPEYKNFDILIINSSPQSHQYNYKKHIWDKYIKILNSNFKILTTTKVQGVLCTFDKRLTIKDIASLSTQAKVIISINSGVLPGLLNTETVNHVKQVYVFDNNCYYSYPNFKNKNCITEISFNELNYYINLK